MAANPALTGTNQIGLLEEDDEFPEFPHDDWEDDETGLAHLTKNFAAKSANSSTKNANQYLWEYNWDDDDVQEQPFYIQLRHAIEKRAQDTSMAP